MINSLGKFNRAVRRSQSIKLLLGITFLVSILGIYLTVSEFIPFDSINFFGVDIPKGVLVFSIYILIVFLLFINENFKWRKNKKNNPIFSLIDFNTSSEDIQLAKMALIDGEGAKPSYVHIAARLLETDKIIDHLSRISNIIFIGGESGTGKSTVALQAAYHLFVNKRYKVYKVKTDFLYDYIDNKRKELNEALDLISDEPSTLIIDDAQKLDLLYKNKFKGILKECSVKNKHLKIIWIETDFETKNELDENYYQIDIRHSLDEVINTFQDFKSEERLASKLTGLDDAKAMADRNKIKDVWQLSLISSKAEQQLRSLFQKLSDFDILAMLYLVSLNTVLTGEKDQDQTFFFQKYSEMANTPELSWLNPQEAKMKLQSLNQAQGNFRRLIQLSSKGAGGVAVSSLHFKFARLIIRILHESKQFEEEYLRITSVLLHDPKIYKDINHLNVWLIDNPGLQEKFLIQEKEWVIQHINNLNPNYLASYLQILKIIKNSPVKDEIINRLDKEKILEKLEGLPLGQFSSLSQFLEELSKTEQKAMLQELKKEKILEELNSVNQDDFQKLNHLLRYANTHRVFDFHEGLKIERLANVVSKISVQQLPNLYQLTLALKKRGAEIFRYIDLTSIVEKINRSEHLNFHHISELMKVLPNNKLEEMLELLDYNHLAEKANKITLVEMQHLEGFLNTLHFRKEGFILSLDMIALSRTANVAKDKNLDSLSRFINALAPLSGSFTRFLDLQHFASLVHLADFNRYRAVSSFSRSLKAREEEFLNSLDLYALAQKVNTAPLENFRDVSFLISVLGERRYELIEMLDLTALSNEIRGIKIQEMNLLRNVLRSTHNRSLELKAMLYHREIAAQINRADLKSGPKIFDAVAAYGNERDMLLDLLDIEGFMEKINRGGFKQLNHSEKIYEAMYNRKHLITENLQLDLFADEINNLKRGDELMEGVFFLPRFLRLADERLREVFPSIEKKVCEIIDYAYIPNAIEVAEMIDLQIPFWSHKVNWVSKMTKFEINAAQLPNIASVLEKIQHMPLQKESASKRISHYSAQFQYALIELINDFREKKRFEILTDFSHSLVNVDPELVSTVFDEAVISELKRMKFTAEEYGAMQRFFGTAGMEEVLEAVIFSASFKENFNQTRVTGYFNHFTDEYSHLCATLESNFSFRVDVETQAV